jgi:arylsulfatase A-like enzyme
MLLLQLALSLFPQFVADADVAQDPAAVVVTEPGAQADAVKPPNVLFLIVDDASVRSVGATGGSFAQTPNIDALAARGVVVDNAYHQGAFSGAICTVSRAMILTGRTVWSVTPGKRNYGGTGNLNTADILMPELFRQHGYQTFFAGKWHNGNKAISRSFDHADAIAGGMLPYNAADHGGARDPAITLGHLNPKLRKLNAASGKFESFTADGWSTDVYFDCAEDYLTEQRDQDKPFFLYLSTSAPHDPRHAPDAFLDLFDVQNIALPINHQNSHTFDTGDLRVRDEMVYPPPHDATQVRREMEIYLAMMAHIDQRVGRLMTLLEKQGELENTLIVFVSDHGLSMGEMGLMGKQNLYEASWRVPMIWAGPGIDQGTRSSKFAYLHGVFPTLCELLDLPTPTHAKPFSVASMLAADGEGAAELTEVFGVYTPNAGSKRGIRAIRQGDWKLIHYLHNDRTQLFHLGRDPWEINDLSASAQHLPRVQKMKARLRQWMEAENDPQQ